MLLFIIAFGVLIIGIIMAGINLANRIDEIENQVFFWILYGVSILTLILILVCIYIYITYRKKTGPLGPRGFQGYPGDKGDSGSCDQNLCRARTLSVLMEKIIEEFNQDPVNEDLRSILCGYVTFTNHPEIFKHWNLMDVKIFRDIYTRELNKEDNITNDNIQSILKATTNKFNIEQSDSRKQLLVPTHINPGSSDTIYKPCPNDLVASTPTTATAATAAATTATTATAATTATTATATTAAEAAATAATTSTSTATGTDRGTGTTNRRTNNRGNVNTSSLPPIEVIEAILREYELDFEPNISKVVEMAISNARGNSESNPINTTVLRNSFEQQFIGQLYEQLEEKHGDNTSGQGIAQQIIDDIVSRLS